MLRIPEGSRGRSVYGESCGRYMVNCYIAAKIRLECRVHKIEEVRYALRSIARSKNKFLS